MSRKLFSYIHNELHFGAGQGHKPVKLSEFVKNYRQPVIVYDSALIQERVEWIQKWPRLGKLHYAMKANFHPRILTLLKRLNCGVDVVSVGEIKCAFAAGFSAGDIIFS